MIRVRFPLFLWAIASLLIAAGPGVSAGAAGKRDFKQPHAYAVVIGISQYREEVIPRSPTPSRMPRPSPTCSMPKAASPSRTSAC